MESTHHGGHDRWVFTPTHLNCSLPRAGIECSLCGHAMKSGNKPPMEVRHCVICLVSVDF
jgi:hypothetical protein